MPASTLSNPMPPASVDRHRFLWPAIGVGTLIVYVAVLLAGVGGPIRPLVTAGFLLSGPGLALVPLARLRDPLVEVVAVVAVSLVLDLLVSMTLLYVGVWTWQRAIVVLGSLVVLGAVVQVVRTMRSADSAMTPGRA